MSLTTPKCGDVTFCQLNMYYAFSIYPAFYQMHIVLSIATVDHFMGHLHLRRDVLSRLRIARCHPPARSRNHVICNQIVAVLLVVLFIHAWKHSKSSSREFGWVLCFVCVGVLVCVYVWVVVCVHAWMCVHTDLWPILLFICLFIVRKCKFWAHT